MIARAIWPQCQLGGRRLLNSPSTFPHRDYPTHFRRAQQVRIFTAGSRFLKEHKVDASSGGKPAQTRSAAAEPSGSKAGPAAAQKNAPTTTTEAAGAKDLLSEANVSRKEQRRVDLAIMKEMTQYLWPKA
jgi:ABC transporter ATM